MNVFMLLDALKEFELPDNFIHLDHDRANSSPLGFRLDEHDWPLQPETLFYDWLYARALGQQHELLEAAGAWPAFSDIHFNPRRSRACQAEALARAVALLRHGRFEQALASPEAFRSLAFTDAQPAHQTELPL